MLSLIHVVVCNGCYHSYVYRRRHTNRTTTLMRTGAGTQIGANAFSLIHIWAWVFLLLSRTCRHLHFHAYIGRQ